MNQNVLQITYESNKHAICCFFRRKLISQVLENCSLDVRPNISCKKGFTNKELIMTSILLPNTRYFIPYLEAHSWKMNLNFGKIFNPTKNYPRPIIQTFRLTQKSYNRSRHPEVFFRKGVLKICSKLTEEHPCLSCCATLMKSHFGMGVLL